MIESRSASAARGRTLIIGVIGGIVGAVVMAMFAMIAAASYQHHGFFTPMYHIASLVLSPEYMMSSVSNAGQGDTFTFFAGPAALGFLIHLVVGAGYGVEFALIARALRWGGSILVPLGVLYGLAAVGFSSFVGLPLAAGLFDAGPPIRDMPTLAGWVTFTIEHLIFGLVLALTVAGFLRQGLAREAFRVRPAEAA